MPGTGIRRSFLENYARLLLQIFKDTNQEESDDYQNWLQQTTFELREVPREWRSLVDSKRDLLLLIYCLETTLLTVYELFLYNKLHSLHFLPEELLMSTPAAYCSKILRLHEFISTQPHVARAFSWHYETSEHPLFSELWLQHQNIVHTIKEMNASVTENSFADIYFNLFPGEVRKLLGEEYTPVEIVRFILDTVGYVSQRDLLSKSFLDPAAGMGVFLIEALTRLVLSSKDDPIVLLKEFSKRKPIRGVEYKLFSAKAGQLNFYLRLFNLVGNIEKAAFDIKMPTVIFQGNTLLLEDAVLLGLPMYVDEACSRRFDYVVGNPPYLRIQNIKPESLKKYYERAFHSSEGRFDLSFLFVERGIQLLKSQGKLAYITTNKFMSSAAGKRIRELVSKKTSIRLLVDLADTEFFAAAVLPCILVLSNEKPDSNKAFPYAVVTKSKSGEVQKEPVSLFRYLKGNLNASALQDVITIKNSRGPTSVKCKIFRSLPPVPDGDTWHFLTPSEQKVIDRMKANANCCLGDIAQKIMVGIKSTADDVFINPMTERFINERKLERELLHPIIRGKNIRKWSILWSSSGSKDRYVLYPHEKVQGEVRAVSLDQYPNVRDYLYSKRLELEKRTYVVEANRNWFEIWVHQDPEYFSKPFKILTPDFSTHNSFAMDTRGFYLGGSALAVILKDQSEEFNYYILGLLNSKLLEFFHKFKSSTFIYAGRYRYWSSYMKSYPVFDYRQSIDSERVEICKLISKLAKKQSCGETNDELEERIDELVDDLFSLAPAERAEIDLLLS